MNVTELVLGVNVPALDQFPLTPILLAPALNAPPLPIDKFPLTVMSPPRATPAVLLMVRLFIVVLEKFVLVIADEPENS